MGLIDDPVSGVLGVFFKKALDSKIAQRLTLLLEMGIATSITFAFVFGGGLIARQSIAWSLGLGLVSSALAALTTFQASPNSKGLTISIRKSIASESLDTPHVTITRS
jgi:hypothetical protein